MKEITDEQAEYIMENGELPDDMIHSGDKVAVIFTQDWCPQWTYMTSWLDTTEKDGITTFYLAYNRKSYFNKFMQVKESTWNNHLVPYVRSYNKGKFIDDSNYVSKELFLSNFK